MSNQTINNPNKAVNSSNTMHFRADENGEPKLYASSQTAGVKSLRLDVATQLLAGMMAYGVWDLEKNLNAAISLADQLIERCNKNETEEQE